MSDRTPEEQVAIVMEALVAELEYLKDELRDAADDLVPGVESTWAALLLIRGGLAAHGTVVAMREERAPTCPACGHRATADGTTCLSTSCDWAMGDAIETDQQSNRNHALMRKMEGPIRMGHLHSVRTP